MQRFRPGGEIRGHPCNGMVNTMRSLESRGQEEERTKNLWKHLSTGYRRFRGMKSRELLIRMVT